MTHELQKIKTIIVWLWIIKKLYSLLIDYKIVKISF